MTKEVENDIMQIFMSCSNSALGPGELLDRAMPFHRIALSSVCKTQTYQSSVS
jgi:hypothetical protein